MLDDYKNFQSLDRDLGNIGLSSNDKMSVYTTIAAILHIGNISFEDDPDDKEAQDEVTKQEERLQAARAQLAVGKPAKTRRIRASRDRDGWSRLHLALVQVCVP